MTWLVLPLKRYFDFRGRSRRREYWSFALLQSILVAGATLLPAIFNGTAETYSVDGTIGASFDGKSTVGSTILLGWIVLFFIPNLAVNVRRLHDRNMSGWWYLGFLILAILPLIGLIPVIAYLVLMLLPGTPGPNRFGLDPKERSLEDVFS